jgi:Na+/H+-dicarboxylate symporter
MIIEQQSSTAVSAPRRWARPSRTHWIFVSMIAGTAIGCCFPDGPNAGPFRASDLEVLSTLFLRMIKLILAPIIFATLVVGIAGHGDVMKRVGRLALLNVLGNCLASVLMARWDGSFALLAEVDASRPDLSLDTVTTFSPLEGVTI